MLKRTYKHLQKTGWFEIHHQLQIQALPVTSVSSEPLHSITDIKISLEICVPLLNDNLKSERTQQELSENS